MHTAGITGWRLAESYAERVALASGGRLIIENFVQGAIVPATKEFEGLHDGIVEMSDTYMGYNSYLLPVAELFSGIPGAFTETQHLFWLLGEGGELYREMIEPLDVVYVAQTVSPAGGDVFVSTVPIEGLADLKGLKFRTASPSLGEIFDRMGMATTMIAWGEIYDALKRGIIDATEAGSLTINWDLSMQEVADYHYLTELMIPGSSNDLFVNKDAWAKLPDDLKAILEDSVRSESFKSLMGELVREAAMAEKYREYGVTVAPLPKEIDQELMRVAAEFFEEKAATFPDPLYARVLESQKRYRAIFDVLAVK
jgi:TRAP-type mannitol/chloroaromatic compound transport system substrate-binding protein